MVDHNDQLSYDMKLMVDVSDCVDKLYTYLGLYLDKDDDILPIQLELIIDATNMQMQRLGEKLNKCSDEFMDLYGDYFNFELMKRTRNLISHNYEGVNENVIRKIIEEELPNIETAIHDFKIYYERKYGN